MPVHCCVSCRCWRRLRRKPSLGECTSGKVFPKVGVPLIEAAEKGIPVLLREGFCCRFWTPREPVPGYSPASHDLSLSTDEIPTILKQNNLSQAALARMLGVSKQSVTDWMKRRRTVVPRPVAIAILSLGLLPRRRLQKGWRYYKEVKEAKRANERSTAARAIPTHLGSD